MRILFVTWDAPRASFLESLFLPIFCGLGAHGIHFDVLQFSWGAPDRVLELGDVCNRAGIGYRQVPIWRKAGAVGPFVSAASGAFHVARAVRTFGSDVVMPRSTMPGLAVLLSRQLVRRPIVFDADGLPIDERVEFAGLSSTGLIYRVLRDVEAELVRSARVVLVRSVKASEILMARAGPFIDRGRFHVVTNGRDPNVFHPSTSEAREAVRFELGICRGAPVLAYVGSLDARRRRGTAQAPRYRLAEMLQLFARVREARADARLLILTSVPELAHEHLREEDPTISDATLVRSVPPGQVARYLAVADLGLAILRPSFSMQAVAPIKTAEYLLCGVPVAGTEGVGDTASLVACGVFKPVGQSTSEELAAVAQWFDRVVLPERERLRADARSAGLNAFALGASIASYHDALRAIA